MPRAISGHGAWRRSYTVTATLSGFKTATSKSIRVAPGQPVSIRSRSRSASSKRRSSSRAAPSSSTPRRHGRGDAERRSAQPHADADAQRAERGHVPARHQHHGHQPRLDDQRPAGVLREHHARRRQQQRQLPAQLGSFFASVTPRQDAVEAVSVTLAAGGAQVGGGAAPSASTSRRARAATGSPAAATSTPQSELQHELLLQRAQQPAEERGQAEQFGARVGGPIVIPGLYDGHNKAFFFAHYEQIRFPNSFTRTRTVLNPRARRLVPLPVRQRESAKSTCWSWPRANGQISAIDPTDAKLLGHDRRRDQDDRHGAAHERSAVRQLRLAEPAELFEHQPTVRLDYNLTDKHRLTGSWSSITAKRTPDYLNNTDARFPGRAEPARLHLDPAADRRCAALHAVEEHGQRAARRHHRLRRRLEFRRPVEHHVAERSQHFADEGGYAITTPTNTHQLVHVQRLRAGARRRPTASTRR